MKSFQILQQILSESEAAPISTAELRHVEKYLKAVWEHLGIDFEFTKHFFERVNDSRNGKQIQAKELVKIFTDVYKAYGTMIASKVDAKKASFDSVLTDLSTKINSPVVVVWNKEKKELEMIAKTVMRVDHFYAHQNQPRLTVQQYEYKDCPMLKEDQDYDRSKKAQDSLIKAHHMAKEYGYVPKKDYMDHETEHEFQNPKTGHTLTIGHYHGEWPMVKKF